MLGLHSRAEPDIAPELTRPLPSCNSWTAGQPALCLAGLGLCTSGWDLGREAAGWEKGQHGAGLRRGLGHFCRVMTGHEWTEEKAGHCSFQEDLGAVRGTECAPPQGACSEALSSDELHGGMRGKSRGEARGEHGVKPGTPGKPHAWGRLVSS